jgi:putative transport protein
MLEWLSKLFLPTETPDVTQSLITIMLAIAIGVFIGRIKIRKVSLGVSAVMFVGLILGHYGYRIQEEILHFIRDFGLILFVYGIGIQVGPSFFSSFKNEGLKLNLLAISTVLLGGVITFILFKTTHLNIENLVGVMSGSVTNTPGLGAAKSTLQEIQNQFPEKKFSDPTIAYAITYPMGVFGVILTIIITKVLLKINPKEELIKFRFSKIKTEVLLIQEKCRVIQPDIIGKTINTKHTYKIVQDAK